MISHDSLWSCLLDRTDTPVRDLVEAYLRHTGWTQPNETGWTNPQYGIDAWLTALPRDRATDLPAIPAGTTLNGLVQEQLALCGEAFDNQLTSMMLVLEIHENRSWTTIWADITGRPAPTPTPPTLTEQACQIIGSLDDLGAYVTIRDSVSRQWWPQVAVDIDANTVITAYPTRPRDVPTAFDPGNCWTIDVSFAPALETMAGGRHAAHCPTAFTATFLRTLTEQARSLTEPVGRPS
ncbi:hypothetical protein [Nocardia tengchongensis]|uniref:hypothetical protein n=1 Tax=Nocardia tengchongensis TaxID=2055889 RepID=UPI0036629532